MARQFGMGAIYALPMSWTPSATGAQGVPIAIIKDATVDFKVTKKPLRGQWAAPIDIGSGPLDISVKIKSSDFRAATIQALLAGSTIGTVAAGSTLVMAGLACTDNGSATYLTTLTNSGTADNFGTHGIPSSGVYVEDGGVLDLTTGLWLVRAADGTATGALTTGQYSVTTATSGIYTFPAADTGHNRSIVFSYSQASVGRTTTYTNQVMGPSTGFLLRVYDIFKVGPSGVLKPLGFSFPNFHFDNLSVGEKAEDWHEQDLSGIAIQDLTSMNVFLAYTGE